MNAPLTFAAVDAMGFTPARQRAGAPALHPASLGPLVELAVLAAQQRLGAADVGEVLRAHPLGSMFFANGANAVVEIGAHAGYFKLSSQPVPDTELTRLSIVTKRSARAAGFHDRSASQLSAALGEMLSNIVEHSESRETGLVAFQDRDGCFEFVAADQGIGALRSLCSNPRFAALATDREALPRVLEHGCSRHNDPGRGAGFDDMFRGLANHNGYLRFRSGDAAVLMDGASPGLVN